MFADEIMSVMSHDRRIVKGGITFISQGYCFCCLFSWGFVMACNCILVSVLCFFLLGCHHGTLLYGQRLYECWLKRCVDLVKSYIILCT